MDKILRADIRTIAKHYLQGTVSPVELAESCLTQASIHSSYNSLITLTNKEANQQASESCERYKSRQPKSLIDGIPVVLKDNFCTKNIATTCAAKMLEHFVPPYNSTVYERLSADGAILIGKSNMDQFAMGSGSVDSIYGPVRNPWGLENDLDFHIAGGSSGGSAVSVLLGICNSAIGSDTGGSTRNPASYCGLVGLKPTYGLVSRHGLIPLVNSMDVPGILTRTIDDCVAILNSVAGFDPKDSTSLTKPFRKIRLPPAKHLSVKGLKVGVPREYHTEHLDKEVMETWNEVANILDENGADIREISLSNTEFSIVCYSILNQCEVASNMARYDGIEFGFRAPNTSSTESLFAQTRSLGFNEVVRNRILAGNYFLLTRNYEKYFEKALKVRRLIVDDFDRAWEQVQVILTPTTLTTAPLYKDFVEKTNRDQCAMQDYCTQPANMAGIPALTIPIKLSHKGLPISVQIMGRSLSEPQLLALGKYLENIVQFKPFTPRQPA